VRTKLAYGKPGLLIDLADGLGVDIIEPKYTDGLVDVWDAFEQSFRNPLGAKPLRDIVKASDRVGIVFSDITRPSPSDIIIPAIFGEIGFLSDENIVLFNSTGTHRRNTKAELVGMLGEEIVSKYRIVQNDATDTTSHRYIGTTSRGNDIFINAEFLDCDVKILTGFIEPHFFAGFSGGPKAVMPGMAAINTIYKNHSVRNIEDPNARWSVTYGNVIWDEILEAALIVEPDFIVNVSLNRDKLITGIFAGTLEQAHKAGCEFVKETSMAAVAEPYDIVITSNSGYPLDLNLYQSVKGISAAAQIIKDGGSIIITADCWDGVPDNGGFSDLLSLAKKPEELLGIIREEGFFEPDMWQAQILALIVQKTDVYFYSENLSDEQICGAFMTPCRDIEETVARLIEKYGPSARICVLPEGPQTIPYLKKEH